MQRREFLQLAHKYQPGKSKVAGWFISEKLDGTRCLWDGGVTRGMRTEDVPYASVIDPKTGNRKSKIKPLATGLWSRYGNPIMAPDWFLDSLPPCLLDGELWCGRGKFQLCRSICGGDTPDPRFDQIRYACYSMPPAMRLFMEGEIKNANFHCVFDWDVTGKWLRTLPVGRCYAHKLDLIFSQEYSTLKKELAGNSWAFAHEQVCLPDDEQSAREAVEKSLDTVLQKGGEGVVIRNPDAQWTPKRVNDLLKYKPHMDREVTITGFTSGRQTQHGGRHLGKIGAVITDCDGQRLEISGFTDEERLFAGEDSIKWAIEHPGRDMPGSTQGKHFKVGDAVTIKYRELSDEGLPKEARYWRRRDVE